MLRVVSHHHAGRHGGEPFDAVTLAHDERHLRRKVLTLRDGQEILVDLPEAIAFHHGDVLVLDDGRMVEILAAEEQLYEIRSDSRLHLMELAWHLGNRHLPTQIEEYRVVILRDHVIKAMLEGLGARVTEIVEPFQPVRGAYHGHSHAHGNEGHDHGRGHRHHDDHSHSNAPDHHHHG
ncbi:urease accessory protein UreE [Mesorhizobium sp. L-8-10]|uniref:urease accessory protein UreE n=1 Tax=Mesorhizobium sp. L-8-10 TaxID=2744523 RepID=UPI0019282915|nr:urease accessory protein UreE [Mesorhizobium sp. L-8-10]BCH32474.1 urease accessory protein UreE [Mesorhizobium sp. L-8-10]